MAINNKIIYIFLISCYCLGQDCAPEMEIEDCIGTILCNNGDDANPWYGYDCLICAGPCAEAVGGADNCNGWLGDGYCDDGEWGANFLCDQYSFDCGDCGDEYIDNNGYCDEINQNDCNSNEVEDCSGDGDCCIDWWIGDGYCDGIDQEWGCDLTCYDNDGGDCDDIPDPLTFSHGGQNRHYYLYLPESIEENAPLIFLMHGYCGSANGIYGYSGMNEIADENGFAVVYPQGTLDQSGCNFWNVGYNFHQNQLVNDVSFLSDLAIYLQDNYNLSYINTFASGMSNGAEMSYMLACHTNDIFKAIAPVAGTMFGTAWSSCSPEPTPILEIHGTNDNITLWDGDYNDNYWGPYPGMDDVIEFWVNSNLCVNNESIQLFGMNTIKHRYFDCNQNVEVWLYEVVNGGHDWPIYSSEEIWTFFNQFISNTGDINQDGNINIIDIVFIVNIILDLGTDNGYGDINNDGFIDVIDIVDLINIILS